MPGGVRPEHPLDRPDRSPAPIVVAPGARDPVESTVADVGASLDYRDPLANERTFLAWIRTALALVAGAVAVVQLLPPLPLPGLRTALGLVLGVAGPLTAVLAHHRWIRTDEAMRNGRTLPPTHTPAFVTTAVVLVGGLVLLLALVRGA